MLLLGDGLGISELAGETGLLIIAEEVEIGVEDTVVFVEGIFTIAFASAGLNIFMLATGLVTLMDPPVVLARLVMEPSLVLETMISFQEISLPTSPPAVSAMLRVQVPLAFLSLSADNTVSGRKDPVKGAVPAAIAVVA